MEKVADLKARIENGTYEIKSEEIAGKMIRESLLNEFLK
jgi:anti-sigma28 factor (negative regulator of flagellin synthesis)